MAAARSDGVPGADDLVRAVLSIAAERNEQAVLDRLTEVARRLTGARHGVAVLLGPDGQPCALAHRGMTTQQVASLPLLPRPLGLIAVVLRGQVLRLPDLSAHPESVGFPAAHVPMTALLGVPIVLEGRVLGGLYLTHASPDDAFGDAQETVAADLARLGGSTLGALRQSIAHVDLLDRLGAVDTRSTDASDPGEVSPAIRRLLAAARDVLGMELAFLSRLHRGMQTFPAVDRAAADAAGTPVLPLAEGASLPASEGYCTLMVQGRIPSAVPDVAAHPVLGAMRATEDLGVGSYCGVPVHLPDGTPYGSLCGLHPAAGSAPTSAQLETLRILARMIGVRLQREADLAADRSAAVQALASYLDGTRRSTVLQPIVDLTSGATVGFEALSRFEEPSGAARRPDETFAEAHSLGIGVRLEQAAAADALALLPDLPAGTYLSVNLSPQAVLDPATSDLFSTALGAADPGRVVLELTEHEHVPDYPALLRVLSGLRERGLRLAVDDTGSGFASLQHVTQLRPDLIKLDVAFVRDIDRDPSRRAVARALIGFAAELDAPLIAEGIETESEHTALRHLGAHLGQGYLLGRPLPPIQALTGTDSRDGRTAATASGGPARL